MIDVLIVMDALGTGGTERQMELLLRHWPASRARVRVLAFAADAGDQARFEELAPTTVLDRRGRGDLGFPLRFRDAVLASGADVLLAPHRFAGLMSLSFAGRRDWPAVVCGIRGRHFFAIRQRILYGRVHPWLCERRASSVLVNARGEIEALRNAHPGLEGRVHWVPNGVVVSRFDRHAERRDWCARHGGDPDRPVIASVGRLAEIKDPLAALDLIEDQELARREVQLVWAGDGPLREKLTEAAGDRGIADRLVLLGDVEDPIDLLAVADVYVHPSRWENTSNAILEAMAARCPVVARRVGGNEDLLQAGEAGLLFDGPRDFVSAVVSVLQDPSSAEARCEVARRTIESRFSVDAMVETHLRYLEDAVSTPVVRA